MILYYEGGQPMNKHNKKDKIDKFWEKLITSDTLPKVLGIMIIFLMTTLLSAMCVFAVKVLLMALGVM